MGILGGMNARQMLDYSDQSRIALRDVLRDQPDVFDMPIQTISDQKSIRLLVAHIAGAEERWIVGRIGGGVIAKSFEERAPVAVDAVFHDWEAIRARTHALVSSLDTAGLGGMIPVKLPAVGYEGKMTIEGILFQVFNHQTYHLGQISMALQQFGVDPPYFDYVALQKRD